MSYLAMFETRPFAAYSLWWVRVRAKPKQRWADATLHAGRTDTESQAWGQIATVTAGMRFPAMRSGAGEEKWSAIRDRLRRPCEKRFQEGFHAWAEWPGDRAALAEAGRKFLEGWRAEYQRREQAERDGFMDGLESLVFGQFCRNTGRDAHDPATKAAFKLWVAEGIEARRREQERTRQRFDFAGAMAVTTRAADLALLGLAPTADIAAIKAAWRRLAMRHHPDRSGDSAEFVRLKAAFERLSGG